MNAVQKSAFVLTAGFISLVPHTVKAEFSKTDKGLDGTHVLERKPPMIATRAREQDRAQAEWEATPEHLRGPRPPYFTPYFSP